MIKDEFKDRIRRDLPETGEKLIAALENDEATTAIRINRRKCPEMPELERVAWCENGFYLKGREAFTFDPLMHAGCYYVQDASSMILSYINKVLLNEPVRYLDLCAAPGGKSLAALDVLPDGSILVSNEIVQTRASILKENIMKWGRTNCIVTNSDASTFGKMEGQFDVIAADVPCSGEGMMRKDEEAASQWSETLVKQCAQLQRKIVGEAWSALRHGGLLIYSTCTFNRSEDEENAEWIADELGAESIDLNMPEEWNVTKGTGTKVHCYHFLPGTVRGEGLFVCVLQKTAEQDSRRIKTRQPAVIKAEQVKRWLKGDMALTTDSEGAIYAVESRHKDFMNALTATAHVIMAGTETATIKGKDAVPSEGLALSTAIDEKAFATAEVDYPTAIAYLRGEAICVEAPKGYVAITYRGQRLGFVKNLGNRANNMLPKNWRIRSSHAPEDAPKIIKKYQD
ncbi:MAG: rRNA cytosine-C5-methyltransferase [Muribaculaceae bacterium]|jgi:16S rRNA C967 or C1407 C5-methylase (RsmB/RsmF family)/NOL1/NOP2/fmu family ribosome biogenesis protein|nr:rRNA cytosine-C5-methyltransferase [Muribaculaceae bacterium]